MLTHKRAKQCFNDTLIADRLFLLGLMTYDFWVYVQEYNRAILADSIEVELTKSILKILTGDGQ